MKNQTIESTNEDAIQIHRTKYPADHANEFFLTDACEEVDYQELLEMNEFPMRLLNLTNTEDIPEYDPEEIVSIC